MTTDLLLDTHVVLWWASNDRRLREDVRRTIRSADRVFVSAGSAWEVAIKRAVGLLRLDDPFRVLVDQSGFTTLPVDFAHAEQLVTLPHHHKDPFDRILVAQAQVERLTVVTHDPRFEPYGVPIVWT